MISRLDDIELNQHAATEGSEGLFRILPRSLALVLSSLHSPMHLSKRGYMPRLTESSPADL